MVADATQSGDKRNAFCQSFHESSIKLTEFWNDLPRSELGSNHPGFNMFQHCSIRTSFPSFSPRPKLRGSVEAWTATTTSSRVHAGRGDGAPPEPNSSTWFSWFSVNRKCKRDDVINLVESEVFSVSWCIYIYMYVCIYVYVYVYVYAYV